METPFTGSKGRQVRGVGPREARIVLLGEAPGAEEEQVGEPFVGPAGRFLWAGRDWTGQAWEGLDGVGLPRSACRIENVCEVRPPENSLLRTTPVAIAKWQADCWERLSHLEPNVIVPMGNLALNTLRRAPLPLNKRGKWKVRSSLQGPQIDWRDKITNWRGSIFAARLDNGERVKVIPTYHPAYVLRNGDAFDVWKGDWVRIVGDVEFPELRRLVCEHLINPSPSQARDFVREVERAYELDPVGSILAGDIETVARHLVDCVGFALDASRSITLDTRCRWSWGTVDRLLAHPIAKGWHFGLFDTFVLRRKGKRIARPLWWDSQQLHHALDPRDEHRLAYCASRDLRVAYWKAEAKEEGTTTRTKDRAQFHRYNGKDVCYTRALIDIYRARVETAGLLDYYREHYRRLSHACLRLSLAGFRVDDEARREIQEREQARLGEIREFLGQACGPGVVARGGGLSSPKVAAYFYDTLGCKPYHRRGSGRRTADELAIRRLMRKYKKARPVGQLILDYRQHGKIAQEVRAALVDEDGRMRSLYTPTAKTGRLRASKTPLGTGVNQQNRDRHSDLRRMFVADEGQVLVEVDLSQAEDRVVDGMGGDPILANTPPTVLDKHVRNAARVFDLEYEDLLVAYQAGDPEARLQRDLGKRTRYACNYGMEGPRMAEITLVETEGRLVLDADECQDWIDKLKAADPVITRYQAWALETLLTKGYAENSWGGRIYFKGLRLGKEDHKELWAWWPQSEVGKLTNQQGFVPADREIVRGRWSGARIVQQGHDSVVVSTPPEFAWSILGVLSENLGTPRTYPGVDGPWTLAMPVGVKVGVSWGAMHEWKGMPVQEEVDGVIEGMITSSTRSAPSASNRPRSGPMSEHSVGT